MLSSVLDSHAAAPAIYSPNKRRRKSYKEHSAVGHLKSDSQHAADAVAAIASQLDEMAENFVKNKSRRIANRGRRKSWINGSRVLFEMDSMETQLPAQFSISSESDSSATEMHDSVVNLSKPGINPHFKRMDSEPWMLGCCIWTEQQLRNSIENLIGSQMEKMRLIKNILESDSQQVWCTLPSSCYDAALLYAAFSTNLPLVKMLLQMGANPLVYDEESRNVLHYAASSPALAAGECCTLLHLHGALVNCWDKQGLATPLICAAALGNIHSVTALLAAGSNVQAGLADLSHPDACTALLWAVRARSPASVEILIEHGAPVNSPQAYRYLNISNLNILKIWKKGAEKKLSATLSLFLLHENALPNFSIDNETSF